MKKITYGFYDTEFGQIVLGQSDKGLCWLGFMVEGYKGDGLTRMENFYKNADFTEDNRAVSSIAKTTLDVFSAGGEKDVALDISGTDFQKSVWSALLNIPRGETKTYGDLAHIIGKPKAVRAVGTAVGSNPVSLIVPCHRIVPKSGGVGNYGWGADIKAALLEAESKP